MLRVPSQIPLERRPRRPSRHCAAYSFERANDYIDAAVEVGILGFRVGFQIGGLGGPVGILPYDESFVEGVEAVTAEGEGVEGKRFLVAFGVCEVQGQGVSDPTLCFEGLDHFVDEVLSHGFVLVGENKVYVATGRPPISSVLFEI